MSTQKIAWLTDIHLNFLKFNESKTFYQQVDQTNADDILITGDIAEATNICELLNEFSSLTGDILSDIAQ